MVERIRVLRLIARMNVGGPALQVVNLIRGLDAHRFDHRVAVGSVGPGEADYLSLRAPEVRVRTIGGLGRGVRASDDVRALRKIVALIREFDPHIVHTHTAKAGVLGRLAARRAAVPATVHTFHGHLLHGYFSPPVTMAIRSAERVLARRTTALVSVGAAVRDELLAARIGTPGQYRVMAPGVALPASIGREEARRLLDLAPDAPVIAFVGRLTGVKRPDRALEVLSRLLPHHAGIVLLVAGEGPLYEEVRTAAADFGPAVRLLGWRGDVGTVYAAADVALLTSDNEGMPVALIEAAMCGLPAVTTPVGSAAEVVIDGRTGFVASLAPDSLALAVDRLLGDPDLARRFGDAAAHHARREFSAERLVRDTEALYEDLVRR